MRNLYDRLTTYVGKRSYSAYLKVARALGLATVKSRYGPKFKANYDDTTFKFCILGKYGYGYWNEIQSIDYDFVYLDIGANQGLYSLGAALNPHLQHAYAFEPVSDTASYLNHNVELNNFTEKITVVNKAVSDRSGCARIFVDNSHSGLATLSENNDLNSTQSTALEIQTIDCHGLNRIIRPKDCAVVLKVDVEGHEDKVIAEIMKTDFMCRVTHIFYEVDERWVDPDKIATILATHDFLLEKIGVGSHYDMMAKRNLNTQ